MAKSDATDEGCRRGRCSGKSPSPSTPPAVGIAEEGECPAPETSYGAARRAKTALEPVASPRRISGGELLRAASPLPSAMRTAVCSRRRRRENAATPRPTQRHKNSARDTPMAADSCGPRGAAAGAGEGVGDALRRGGEMMMGSPNTAFWRMRVAFPPVTATYAAMKGTSAAYAVPLETAALSRVLSCAARMYWDAICPWPRPSSAAPLDWSVRSGGMANDMLMINPVPVDDDSTRKALLRRSVANALASGAPSSARRVSSSVATWHWGREQSVTVLAVKLESNVV